MSPRGEGREHLTFPVLKDQRMHLLWDDTATRKHKNASSGSKTWGRIESLKCLPKSHRDTVPDVSLPFPLPIKGCSVFTHFILMFKSWELL